MSAPDDAVTPPTLSPFWGRALELVLRAAGASLLPITAYLTVSYAIPIPAVGRLLGPYAMHVLAGSVVFGVGATTLWMDHEARLDSSRLHYVIQAVVRYFLAFIFVIYGLAKFYRTQLYAPFLEWLDTPVGELSGFALTWTFFGSSYPYVLFIGASQLLCAALLLFRRTQLLGAILLLPIIGNIVIVNFAYNIPVKLNSCIFLAMTVYLVLSDFKLLKAFFWDHRPASGGWWPRRRTVAQVIKATCVVVVVGTIIWRFEGYRADWSFVRRPVVGIWNVDAFELKGQRPDESGASPEPWTKVIFEAQGGGTRAVIERGDRTARAAYTVDTTRNTLQIRDSRRPFIGRYRLVNERYMVLTGTYGPDSLRVELLRME